MHSYPNVCIPCTPISCTHTRMCASRSLMFHALSRMCVYRALLFHALIPECVHPVHSYFMHSYPKVCIPCTPISCTHTRMCASRALIPESGHCTSKGRWTSHYTVLHQTSHNTVLRQTSHYTVILNITLYGVTSDIIRHHTIRCYIRHHTIR